ncbi:RHS repeat domain-containing protein [Luteibacter sp. CQ10]|uniref:RHS repeat domain-containing protein n=1 Tax=Luteibacter sp. CQ10 TaxID=2805821 RepID=UPI0034A1ACA3
MRRLILWLGLALLVGSGLQDPAMASGGPATSTATVSKVALPQPNQQICQQPDHICPPQAPNHSPVITWTAVPAANSAFLPTDVITVGASATDQDTWVSSIVFYIDHKIITTYSASSFRTTFTGLAPGGHTLAVVAYDSTGKSGETGDIPFTVLNSVVTGNIDGVSSDGVISGWACSTYMAQSINVDLYVGGAAGTGVMLGRYTANVGSEPAVASACGVGGGSYRFQIALTSAQRVQFGGQAIYLHGISPIGAANNLLPGSGRFTVPVAVRNAQFVGQSVATTMQVGGVQTVNVQMYNNGNYTWTAGTAFKLGSVGNSTIWGPGRVELPSDIAPGQTASFTFNITAPSTPGAYTFQWQMLQEGVAWFGTATPAVGITVLGGTISANPGTCAIDVGNTTCASVITWSSNSATAQVWTSNLDGSAAAVVASGQNGSQALGGIGTAGRRFLLKSGSFTLASVDTHAIPPPEVATTVSIDYDELGHVIARRDASGQVKESYQYDANGQLIHSTDALNHVRSLSYDALGRVVSSADADNATTSYTYDADDRIVRVVDPRGNATTYDYDGFGQLWRQVSPDSGITTFSYDGNGLLQSMTRANGVQTAYGYDGLNRLTSVTAGGMVQHATYDSCTNGAGRLCSVADATGTTSYSYTPEGDIAGRGFSIAGTGYGLGYAYDGLGRLSAVVYPDGNQLNYAYAYGRLSGATLTANGATTPVASALTYRGGDASFTGWTSSNGLTNTLSYDGDGRLTGISVPGVQGLGFGYDAADRITRITNGRDASLTQTFQYDSVSRLTSATSTANSEGFQYDTNGNRTSHVINGVTQAQGIDPASNRLVSMDTQALGYDANGNLTTVGGVGQYHYDVFNRMDSATGTTYYVNPEGQRLRKVGTLGTTFFAPDRGGPLLAEYANGGWVDYVWINERLIGRVAGGQVYAIHADQVGRPEVATNASRSIVWSAENLAFDRQVVTEGFKLNLGFPGQYFDDETKTWNNGFRDYRADLGRYVESDPIGLVAGTNTYGYVGNNPLTYYDAFGLEAGVTIWQPVGWGESSFGHVSVDINGITYSFGPAGMTVMSTAAYNQKNEFRNGVELKLNVSSSQEHSLKDYLSNPRGGYDILMNNCGGPVQRALMKAGIDTGGQLLPVSLGNKLLDMGVVNGIIEHPAINPARRGGAPWAH